MKIFVVVLGLLFVISPFARAAKTDPGMDCKVNFFVTQGGAGIISTPLELAEVVVNCQGYEKYEYTYIEPNTEPQTLTYSDGQKTVTFENQGYRISAYVMPEKYIDDDKAVALTNSELTKAGLDPKRAELARVQLSQNELLFNVAGMIKNPFEAKRKEIEDKEEAEARVASIKKLGCTASEANDMPALYSLDDVTGDIKIRPSGEDSITAVVLPEKEFQSKYYFSGNL